jgi:hypothetical protein
MSIGNLWVILVKKKTHIMIIKMITLKYFYFTFIDTDLNDDEPTILDDEEAMKLLMSVW